MCTFFSSSQVDSHFSLGRQEDPGRWQTWVGRAGAAPLLLLLAGYKSLCSELGADSRVERQH